jgi:hypothetical protein
VPQARRCVPSYLVVAACRSLTTMICDVLGLSDGKVRRQRGHS